MWIKKYPTQYIGSISKTLGPGGMIMSTLSHFYATLKHNSKCVFKKWSVGIVDIYNINVMIETTFLIFT